MAANTAPIFPLKPYIATANLSKATACTTRMPTAYESMDGINAVPLTAAAGTDGRRIDRIQVKGTASAISGAVTTASTVTVWYGAAATTGTTFYPIKEIVVTAVTGMTAQASFDNSVSFTDLVMPSGSLLYASCTVGYASGAHNLSVYAFGGEYS